MYKFFGELIFQVMVVVCTNYPEQKYQNQGSVDTFKVKNLMNYALHSITGNSKLDLEVIYIPYEEGSDDHTIKQLIETYDKTTAHTLKVNDLLCVKCSNKSHSDQHGPKQYYAHFSRPYIDNMAKIPETDRAVYEFFYYAECSHCHRPPGTKGCGVGEHSSTIPSLTSWYYTILLLGKKGIGKTTTARKLFQWHKYKSVIKSLDVKNGTEIGLATLESQTEDGAQLPTFDIQAWLNPVIEVCVIVMQGFADTVANPEDDSYSTYV